MQEVEARDRARIARINSLDADGYWDLVQDRQDDLKWCGSSPFYTFLKTAPKSRPGRTTLQAPGPGAAATGAGPGRTGAAGGGGLDLR